MGILSSITGSGQARRARLGEQRAGEYLQQGADRAAGYYQPVLDASQGALSRLSAGVAPGGEFYGGYQSTFDPAKLNLSADPSYKFRLQEGSNAIERSAAARGQALSGQTLKALAGYGQDLASQEYGNAYNRALGQDVRNESRFYGDQANRYGRLSNLAGLGVGANEALAGLYGGLGTNLANNVTGSVQAQNNAYTGGIGRLTQMAQTGMAAAGMPSMPGGAGAGMGGYGTYGSPLMY